MINPNDPSLKSWIEVPQNSDFPIQNLPFGIFKISNSTPRAGVAIGEYVVDLNALSELGFFNDLFYNEGSLSPVVRNVFNKEYLNDFISLGKPVCSEVRARISELLRHDNSELRDNEKIRNKVLYKTQEVTMHFPVKVGDYTDFYSSEEHATNVGSMFRDPKNALLPNWKHMPVAYHGRASSIIVSGTNIHRPKGQSKADNAENPTFGPSKNLDFELEMAFIAGKRTKLGESISINDAEEYIFGFVLFNDWSARDIQKWEYVPLGPFLGKNFASSISPWVVTLEALEPFRVEGKVQSPKPLPYLQVSQSTSEQADKKNFDINLEVYIEPSSPQPSGEGAIKLTKTNFKYMYWNINQQLAHHTVNGCNINVGDMFASGTISGPTEDSYGSMLELSWKGTKPIKMPDGTERKFINDGDTVIMRAYGEKNGVRIGFGEVRTKVLPAL
ncbi:MAG: fumarylacetoacetase [Cytophagales bacterium]|nr:fumarylacetoacetase [Cytophagales bacterium]